MLSAEAPIHRLSVEDVRRMVDAGVLGEDDRVELVDGVLVDMSPPGAAHSAVVAWLTRHFVSAVQEREVRVQDLLLVEGGFLMPDLMVVDPLPRDRQPATAALVIEVSVTTQRYDAAKAARYARAGVPEYWVVDVPARTVHVHRGASPSGYGEIARHGDGAQLATEVAASLVDVSAMLG
jgi:Uma2 family endonuclease